MRTIATLALSLLAVADAASQETWQYTHISDDFTGESSHIVSIDSVETIETLSATREPATLQLRCDEDNGSPYWRLTWPVLLDSEIDYNPLVGVSDETNMQVRFDDGRIYGPSSLTGGWPPEEPVGSRQSVRTNAVNAVLNKAEDATVMMVRDTAWDGTQLTVSFDLAEFNDAVEQLKNHCRRL